ncbi:MAG: class I SAM-dependent rRNA methyltransferase [Angelakisella sp.]|nr:class I SAM-dependent rRNA methyltransferase [Angelakisella sp.]
MIARDFPVFTVTPKAERSLRAGHPWVYGEEITAVEGGYRNGDMVDVVSSKGRYLGTGWVNDHSKIRVRILSRNANDTFDEAFFRRRVRYALDYRKTVMGPADYRCCRLIFGEADQFPGLTVDRFENVLVTQTLSLGMEQRKEWVFRALVEGLREDGAEIAALYERNDVAIRELEGLRQNKGFYPLEGLRDDLDGHVIITENGLRYDVDYIEGQKTGFFLDQKYNRQAAARLARDRRVLDCFTHTGAFALNAAAARAAHVTAVDVSQFALELAAENGRRNGLTNLDFLCADVFDLLTRMAREKKCDYDYIILDPPAFTKSRATADRAYHGYKEINLKAMRLLPRGGYLATCSCSHFMSDEMFRRMLREAAQDAGVTLRQIEARQQAPDHPILPGVPETDYLKFYLLQVV